MKILSTIFVLMLLISAGCAAANETTEPTEIIETPEVQLTQTPTANEDMPKDEPLVFAEGVISSVDQRESYLCFSPTEDEVYFTRSKSRNDIPSIYSSKLVGGQWSEPKILSFCGTHRDFNPYITNDGKHMLFFRVQDDSSLDTGVPKMGTWISQRTESGWSEPEYFMEGYCTTTPDFVNFYFTSNIMEPDKTDIDYVTYDGTSFSQLIKLEGDANSESMDIHSCISRDGQYIVFDSQRKTGTPDDKGMYISKKNEDGVWSTAKRIDEILNVAGGEMPSFSPDGQYLFFSLEDNIYWVSLEKVYESFSN